MHPVEPEELMAYLDGELPSGRAAEAAAHLEHCPDCQRLAADLRGLSRHLLAWEIDTPTAPMPEIAAAQPGRRKRLPYLSRWRFVAIAGFAACLALFVSNLMFFRTAPLRTRPAASLLAPPAGPQIARTAQLTLTADVAKARAAVDEILKRHHGYTAARNVSTTLQATLRVPAAELDSTLADLRKLGRVEQESQSGEEVTQQAVDLDARLTNARNTEQRLAALLRDRAGSMQDVLAVENEITRVRGQIESLEAEKKTLAARVEFATIQIAIAREHKAQLNLWPAAVEGYHSMIGGLLGAAQIVLGVGPTLLIWSLILFWPARALWRRLRFSR